MERWEGEGGGVGGRGGEGSDYTLMLGPLAQVESNLKLGEGERGF